MAADRRTPTRRTRFGVSILLVVGALLALSASSALADAGNPIIGTTKADLVQNPDGTVTVYVRGQWNWLSHKSDCNFDRAATGLSMIWNDSTETGYTLTGKTVKADVGVKEQAKSWVDPNPIDGMVHPVDRGNIPEGLPGVTNPPFKVEQTFFDPAPQAAGQPHPTTTWRGGCGREPLTHVDAYTNFPWGSWGYEKKEKGTDGNFHLGYSHVYRSRDFVPKSVCVNFYDVHDSGFQVPNSSSSLDVLANDDNSIEENDFAVNGGSCVHFVKIKTKSIATANLGEPITDTATITDAVTTKTPASDGTITFTAFKDPTTCTGKADFTSGPTAVDLDASTEVTSEQFSPTSTGTYYWIATFHSTADPQATDISTTCKEAEEVSVVGKAAPELKTKATTTAIVGDNISDVATLAKLVSPANTGTVTFDIYKGADCSGAKLNANPIAATPATVNANGDYTSANFPTTATGAGEYHWIAHFSGDANNKAVDGKCLDTGENTKVEPATPELKTKATTTAIVGDNISDVATLAKLVSPANTGTVTFDIYKGADCSGAKLNANPIAATPATVNANGDYTSANFPTTATGAGEYHWIAHFSGDANNKAVDGKCLDTGENTKVEPATPELKTKATTTAIVGDNISDVATLAKLVSPANTGTVTFDIYKGADCSGAKLNANPIAATPATVNANGDYTSANFPTTATGAGEYHWIAHFSGDANNKAVDGKCLDTGENTKVEPATPELKTKATTTAIVGDNISDVATLAKLVSPANTGTVTFDIYKGADCSGAKLNANPIAATPATVNANGDYTSANFPTTATGAGEYHWIAHFSGDANNKAVDGKCLDTGENTKVEPATPELKTKATTTAIVGDNISDVATLAKLVSPANTGTVTFDIYKGADCSGAKLNANPIAATPATVNANGDYTSANFSTTATGAGEYHWIAHFSGDANNKAVDGKCLDTGENTKVEPATPELKTKATTTAIVGDNISDVATLAKLVSPANTGTVTFDIYKGADCSGAKLNANPIAATPATVNANGDYTSANFSTTATGAGEYHWIAHFSGDANNKAVDGKCLDTGENTKVEPATPELKTKATTTAIVGDNISDVATLAKLVSPANTGTVTFDIYKGADCSGAKLNANPIAATPATVNANGDYTSANFPTTATGAGEYHWIAHFSGDANNKAVDGKCLDTGENTKVEPATPELKTKATTTAIVGENISDVATLAKLVSPANTGTVTFDIYKGADCSGAKLNANPIAATPATVNANGDYTSANFPTTATGAGEYHWIAHFSGDANNKAVDGKCLDTGENTKVEPATPELKTKATTTAIVGDNISDVATLAKLVSPANTGTVTFDIYKGADCSGAKLNANPIAATPATVNANGDYTSANFPTTATGAGEYHWIAHFSGDANNKAVNGTCLATGENTTVEKASPQITTDAGPGTVLGGQVTDTAHLSGGHNPTGSITFRLYNNPNCAGTPAAEATNSSVNGNGDYASPPATPAAAGEYFWVAIYSGDANNKGAQTGCSDPSEKVTITNPPAGEVAASKIPPPECKLRKARARFFIYTRHNRVRLVIRYVAYTKATITTSFVMHGRKGNLNLGKATKTFNKKGVFRLPKHLTPAKMKKIRAATDFGVQFQIPGTPAFCQAYFKRTLTVARFVEGQKVWFQTGSVFGGDV